MKGAKMKKGWVYLLSLTLFLGILYGQANIPRNVISKLTDATVCIAIYDVDEGNYISHGSGFLARNSNGNVRVYTAAHVISDLPRNYRIYMFFWNSENGMLDILRPYLLEPVSVPTETEIDFASLRIYGRINLNSVTGYDTCYDSNINRSLGMRCLSFANDNGRVGQMFYVAGYPDRGLNPEQVITKAVLQVNYGTISSFARGIYLLAPNQDFDFGQSGGPIVNADCQVIGVATAITESNRPANLGLPVSYFKNVIAEIPKYRYDVQRFQREARAKIKGRVIDDDDNTGIPGILVFILNYHANLENIDTSDFLDIVKTDNNGDFITDRYFTYGMYYIGAYDSSETYKSTLSELNFQGGDRMCVIRLERQEIIICNGTIRDENGRIIRTGILTVFSSFTYLSKYLACLKNQDRDCMTQISNQYVIGAGEIVDGEFTLNFRNGTTPRGYLLVLDLERANLATGFYNFNPNAHNNVTVTTLNLR